MNTSKKFLLGLVLLGFSQLNAQQNLTLKEAVDYALQNKADAKKAELQIKNSDYVIADAKSAALPKINASGGITYNPILQKSALPGDMLGRPGEVIMVPFGRAWGSQIGVQLQQTLFSQQVFIGLKAAKTTKEFYQVNKQLTDEQLIENVSTAYYQVFTQKEKLKTVETAFESTQKVRNIIKSLYDNGLAKKVDLDRTNVNLTNQESNITQLKNAVTLSENALKFYIGMPIETPITLASADVQVEAPLLKHREYRKKNRNSAVGEKKNFIRLQPKSHGICLLPFVGFGGKLRLARSGR